MRAVDDDFNRLAQRTGKSVAACKEGMDELQKELKVGLQKELQEELWVDRWKP